MLESLPPFAVLWRPLLSLILASAIVMGSPGPSTISLTAVAAAFGANRSLPYLAGLVLGTAIVLAAVLAGLVTALLAVPSLAIALSIAATLYLLYLAWRIASAPPLNLGTGAAQPPSLVAGLLLGIANPKAYAAIAAVVAGNALVAQSPGLDAALKGIVLMAMIVLIHVVWMIIGAIFARALADPRRSRIANIVLAIALAASCLLALPW